ncbi:MAG TPA: hypothetical protein VMH48_00250 [Methylomirabilota bacterium]|nr:hypothetical protein [Methylomirabilota bacterium]
MGFLLAILAHRYVAFPIPGKVFWPYFAGTAILFIGLVRIIRAGSSQWRGIDGVAALGPLFFAIPLAVFGADHFVASKVVASIVPSWIPWHLFWAYFVGVALLAAALSLVTQKHSLLASTLLSAMLFSFVLLIHVPNFVKNPHNRFFFALPLREMSFSAGALARALAQADGWPKLRVKRLTILARCAIAVPTVVFGVEHFLFPQFVPVIPLKQLVPSWIPGHVVLAYVTGAVLIACGLSIILNWRARQAATLLGIAVFAIVLLVYLPIMAANASDIGIGLNYFADTLMFSGSALLLSGILPSREFAKAPAASRADSAARNGLFQGG